MVSEQKVDSQFLQNVNSCVLASYAIIGKYFTKKPIEDFFTAYCDHFGLSYNSWQDAEEKYDQHFDKEWRKKNCEGYKIIIELHNTSREPIFELCRSIYTATFYGSSSQHIQMIEDTLKKNESFLNITFQVSQDFHSITVFHGTTGLLVRDTTKIGISPLTSLASIGTLRDSVLYRKI
jgi:hypothetical protein